MRVAFDLNGVIRDTFTKAEQLYQKHYIDEFEDEIILFIMKRLKNLIKYYLSMTLNTN